MSILHNFYENSTSQFWFYKHYKLQYFLLSYKLFGTALLPFWAAKRALIQFVQVNGKKSQKSQLKNLIGIVLFYAVLIHKNKNISL